MADRIGFCPEISCGRSNLATNSMAAMLAVVAAMIF
jgi:hypothetical protein